MGWKKFEQKVYELQKFLSPESRIIYDFKKEGFLSRTTRQTDVALFDKIGSTEIFIAVECKDKKRKIGVAEVDGFNTKIRDIMANKGVMVASNGFTKGAVNLAKNCGIDLYVLSTNEDVKELNIKGIVEIAKVTHYSYAITNLHKKFLNSDFRKFNYYTTDNTPISNFPAYVLNLWNIGIIPAEAGRIEKVIKVKILDMIEFYELELRLIFVVQLDYYSKLIPVAEIENYIDIIKGEVVSLAVRKETYFNNNNECLLDESYSLIEYVNKENLKGKIFVKGRILFDDDYS